MSAEAFMQRHEGHDLGTRHKDGSLYSATCHDCGGVNWFVGDDGGRNGEVAAGVEKGVRVRLIAEGVYQGFNRPFGHQVSGVSFVAPVGGTLRIEPVE